MAHCSRIAHTVRRTAEVVSKSKHEDICFSGQPHLLLQIVLQHRDAPLRKVVPGAR